MSRRCLLPLSRETDATSVSHEGGGEGRREKGGMGGWSFQQLLGKMLLENEKNKRK